MIHSQDSIFWQHYDLFPHYPSVVHTCFDPSVDYTDDYISQYHPNGYFVHYYWRSLPYFIALRNQMADNAPDSAPPTDSLPSSSGVADSSDLIPTHDVFCKCGFRSSTFVVKKAGPNYGKRFYKCNTCKVWEWEEDALKRVQSPPHIQSLMNRMSNVEKQLGAFTTDVNKAIGMLTESRIQVQDLSNLYEKGLKLIQGINQYDNFIDQYILIHALFL